MTNPIWSNNSGRGHPDAEIHSSLMPPANFADVALIDAEKCAAIGDMSVSWWHDEVRSGRAPAPVIRRQRCTRWKVTDVREFWRRFAEQDDDTQVVAKATKASAAAKAKRAARAASTEGAPRDCLPGESDDRAGRHG